MMINGRARQVNAPLDLQATAATTTTTTGVCESAARRAGQAAEAGRDRDDARGWAWICGLSVVVVVVVLRGRVRAVVAQKLVNSRRQDDRYIQKVRKTRELMIGRSRENKGRARSQWRTTPAGSA